MAPVGSKPPAPVEGGRARPLSRWLRAPISLLEITGKIIAAATLAFMFCVLLANVILRYLFSAGLPWASEIHAVLLPWLVAGGIVVAVARGRNIAISLLPDLITESGRRWLFVIVNLCILMIAVNVLWTSQPILKAAQFQRLSTLGIRQIWGYASLVYAFGAMAVIAALEALRALLEPPDETRARVTTSLS